MKTIVLAAAIAAAAIASPALAKSANVTQHVRHHSQRALDANAAFNAPDPYGVYVDGREIGRDPDANIRSSLRGEYYELQGN
jgi:hypothetical protein